MKHQTQTTQTNEPVGQPAEGILALMPQQQRDEAERRYAAEQEATRQ